MNTNLLFGIITGIFVGLASGYLGSILVLRRMSLVGDALSHVALPGIAIAFLLNINPFFGAFTFLAFAILVVWKLEQSTSIPTEALVGVLFTVSLAVGILITPEPELLEALFGNIGKVSLGDMAFAIFLSLFVFVVGIRLFHNLILETISKDLARASGISTKRINLLFLIMVAIVVALGVRVVGTLLMGALVIIPAAAARNFSYGLKRFAQASALIGVLSASIGVFVSYLLVFPPGPVVVLVSALFFLISLGFRR